MLLFHPLKFSLHSTGRKETEEAMFHYQKVQLHSCTFLYFCVLQQLPGIFKEKLALT